MPKLFRGQTAYFAYDLTICNETEVGFNLIKQYRSNTQKFFSIFLVREYFEEGSGRHFDHNNLHCITLLTALDEHFLYIKYRIQF